MGYKHQGGHHKKFGTSLPTDYHTTISIGKEDADSIRQIAVARGWKIKETVHWMVERIRDEYQN